VRLDQKQCVKGEKGWMSLSPDGIAMCQTGAVEHKLKERACPSGVAHPAVQIAFLRARASSTSTMMLSRSFSRLDAPAGVSGPQYRACSGHDPAFLVVVRRGLRPGCSRQGASPL
jgi:hypothetical protein